MKKQLVIMQGPPKSGKTAWAVKQIMLLPHDMSSMIVTSQDLTWNNQGQDYIIHTLDHILSTEVDTIKRTFAVADSFRMDGMVIVDAYNINPQRVQAFRQLADEIGAELIIKELYVPYTESQKRNKGVGVRSKKYIPKGVVARFYDTYYHEQYRDELTDKRVIRQPELTLPSCIICDLDATLALHQGREPFDWDGILTDKIDPRLRDLLNIHMKNGTKVFFLTGRTAQARRNTLRWLLNPEQGLCSGWELIARSRGDFSSGEIYKRKMYEQRIQDKYNVLCVFEDSNKCVSMWRELGLLTCQVANSDY